MKKRTFRTTLLAAALIAMVLLTGCKALRPEPEVIDLNDYLTYELSGFDGEGVAQYYIDLDGVIADHGNLEGYTATAMRYLVKGDWTQDSDLTNGDVIRFEWTVYPETIEEEYNVEFVFEDVEVTVEGLEAKPEFDPFEHVEVNVSGIAPMGQISIPQTSSVVGTICYQASQTSGLSNGDVVTITALSSTGDLAESADENGYRLVRDSMSYTVTGIDEYLTSVADLNEDSIDMLFEQAVNAFYAAHDFSQRDIVINALDYDGIYLLNRRETTDVWSAGAENMCYVVLKVNLSQNGGGEVVYYYFVSYRNVVLQSDGTLLFDSSYFNVPYGSDLMGIGLDGAIFISPVDNNPYIGYEDLDTLYLNEIQNLLVSFTCDSTYQ